MTRILVTGGTGFIGSKLLQELDKTEHTIFAFERYVSGRYQAGAERTHHKYLTVFGDLTDPASVKKTLREIKPEVVIHLAALSLVAYSYDHPLEVQETNCTATINLAELCLRELPYFKHFIMAGTSEMFGIQPEQNFPMNEETTFNPNSPYSVSKVAAVDYLEYMKQAYDFPITVMIPFNTYGGTSRGRVTERMIEQMLTQKVCRLGDPDTIRDLLYIDDHVNAYLQVLGNPKAIGERFCFCTGQGWTIKDVACMTASLTHFEGEIEWHTIPQRPLDVQKLVGTHKKATELLNWEPEVPLHLGLKYTIDSWRQKLGKA